MDGPPPDRPTGEGEGTMQKKQHDEEHNAPGTVVLTFLLLAWIAFLYFGGWITLAQAWGVK
jgi:hypothetical protein